MNMLFPTSFVKLDSQRNDFIFNLVLSLKRIGYNIK